MVALENGQTECVEALLPLTTSPDQRCAAGLPCLHRAARRGLSACVKLLLEAKASVDLTDGEEQTPLHAACHAGQPVCAPPPLHHQHRSPPPTSPDLR